jgi:DNA replication protein DnaC
MDVIRPVMDAPLLVLDDLGAERLTDWVEETMNVIVNSRYNARLPTIFTSNYEDVQDREDMNSLLVRVGFRLHSRLREMCEFLEYEGPDYRELPPNADADDIYKLWKSQPRRKLPGRSSSAARAQLREPAVRDGRADLKWPGGRAGS